MFFFSPFAFPLNREKLCINREKIGTKKATIFLPLVFHRLRLLDLKHLKTLKEWRRNGLSKNTLFENRFSARRLLRSSSAPLAQQDTKEYLNQRDTYIGVFFGSQKRGIEGEV